ncbi:hypothetical protein ISF70_28350 [Burkholderia pseudomallei]|nr:hypothetical protein [Burkholderia pseudomallei]
MLFKLADARAFAALRAGFLGGDDFSLVAVERIGYRGFSEGARWMNTPRTISSSVRRAQSSASRFVRNVLATVGQPTRRMVAFQVPEGVFVSAAMVLLL